MVVRYDLDNEEEEEENDDPLATELKMPIKRPEPEKDFISIQLGDDPANLVKIGSDLPNEIKENLTVYLKQNADILPGLQLTCLGYHPR